MTMLFNLAVTRTESTTCLCRRLCRLEGETEARRPTRISEQESRDYKSSKSEKCAARAREFDGQLGDDDDDDCLTTLRLVRRKTRMITSINLQISRKLKLKEEKRQKAIARQFKRNKTAAKLTTVVLLNACVLLLHHHLYLVTCQAALSSSLQASSSSRENNYQRELFGRLQSGIITSQQQPPDLVASPSSPAAFTSSSSTDSDASYNEDNGQLDESPEDGPASLAAAATTAAHHQSRRSQMAEPAAASLEHSPSSSTSTGESSASDESSSSSTSATADEETLDPNGDDASSSEESGAVAADSSTEPELVQPTLPSHFEPIQVRPSRQAAMNFAPAASSVNVDSRRQPATIVMPTITTTRAPATVAPNPATPRVARPSSFSSNARASASFDLNMGADRMMISSPNPIQADFGADSPARRRQADMLHLAASVQDPVTEAPQSHSQRLNEQQQFANSLSDAQANICYTPLALILVVLITISVTLTCCLCAFLVMKHYKRHQFDLVANNSKHFDGSHLESRSFPTGYSMQQGAAPRPAGQCMLHLFQADRNCVKCNRHRQSLAPNESVASFRNPYFSPNNDNNLGFKGNDNDNNDISQFPPGSHDANHAGGLLLKTAAPDGVSNRLDAENEPSNLHYAIESHIANLHNRQVTSSVQELDGSLSGGGVGGQRLAPMNVVDLTNDEQRARILSNPRQGDLVSVDLVAHDIIGLGFEVCGNSRDGIFIRSINSRGPARASGCLEPGDRLKCVNISFENTTLEDACDLLTCGSPYRLRLLVEKRALGGALNSSSQDLAKLISSISKEPNASSSPYSLSSHQSRQRQHLSLASGAGPAFSSSSTAILDPDSYTTSAYHHYSASRQLSQGPVTTTRNYLRRVAARLLGNNHNHNSPTEQNCCGTIGDPQQTSHYLQTSKQQQQQQYQQQQQQLRPPIGSQAAKQQLQLERGFMFQHQLDQQNHQRQPSHHPSPATSTSQIEPATSSPDRSQTNSGQPRRSSAGQTNAAFDASSLSEITLDLFSSKHARTNLLENQPRQRRKSDENISPIQAGPSKEAPSRAKSQPEVSRDDQASKMRRESAKSTSRDIDNWSSSRLMLMSSRSVQEFTPISQLMSSARAMEDIRSPVRSATQDDDKLDQQMNETHQ